MNLQASVEFRLVCFSRKSKKAVACRNSEVQSLGGNGEDGTFLLMPRCPARRGQVSAQKLHVFGRWWEQAVNGLVKGKHIGNHGFSHDILAMSCHFPSHHQVKLHLKNGDGGVKSIFGQC